MSQTLVISGAPDVESAAAKKLAVETTETTTTPVHQWTHTGDRVLIIKCTAKGGISKNGFVYPRSGKVKPANCTKEPMCDSGGLFGWPWGIGFGTDKEPDYNGDWFVLAAKPDQVIAIGDKVKVAADTPDEVDCDVVYAGDAIGAIMFCHTGKMAWIAHSASGYSGNAAASGYRGNAAASGYRGNAAASGYRGNAAASGYSGNAAASGESGNAAASGYSGNAAASGERGNAAASGVSGIGSLTGEYGSIEVGPQSLGAVTSSDWTWKQHPGAVVICRWKDKNGVWQHRVFVGENDDVLHIVNGKIVK